MSDTPPQNPNIGSDDHDESLSKNPYSRPTNSDGSFVRPEHHKEYVENTGKIQEDPVISEAFSPTEPNTKGLEPDPLALYGKDYSTFEEDTPKWKDPEAKTQLGRPAIHNTWETKIVEGKKIGVREVLFGRVVSGKSLALLAGLAILLAGIGGYIGRITGKTQIQLQSKSVGLSFNDGKAPQTELEQAYQKVSKAVVQVVVSIPGNSTSFGTGVVVDPQGYIWTNNHVISDVVNEKNPLISVVFRDSTRVPAKIVGHDAKTDVAVLKVSVNNLQVATLGDSNNVQVGQDVFAVGDPLGLSQSLSSGVVSAINRPWTGTSDQPMADSTIQTDTPINHGNSGGGLFDMNGRLIGITNGGFGLGDEQGSIGINTAININQFAKVAEQITKTGTYKSPYVGLGTSSVATANYSGATITNVAQGSPAANAGLRVGDVIVKLGDKTVASSEDFVVDVELLDPNKPVDVEYFRGNQRLKATINPGTD